MNMPAYIQEMFVNPRRSIQLRIRHHLTHHKGSRSSSEGGPYIYAKEDSMLNFQPEDCACILSSSAPCKIVLPLAVLCLRTIVNTLPSRESVSSRSRLAKICGFHAETVSSILFHIADSAWLSLSLPQTNDFSSVTSMGRLSAKLKAKKRHEIDRLVNLVELLSLGRSFHSIIDIGAGMGHLSRILSISLPDCSIIAVEKEDDLVKKSVLLNERLRRCCNSSVKLEHRCESVRTSSHRLDIPEFNNDQRILVIGLHSCGDLSSSILRLFVESQNVAALILFGCCYHKLSVINEEQNDFNEGMPQAFGFPLSLKYSELRFSRCALDLACHSNENYVMQLLTKPHSSYRTQCYRAVLECLIANHMDDEIRRRRTSLVINSVDGNKEPRFEEYVKLALARYPDMIEAVSVQIASDDNASTLINSVDDEWRRLLVVHCIRLLFAPIVEHIIIEDRVQFLRERGHSVFVVPLFDPKISPRNLAIVAFKNSCDNC